MALQRAVVNCLWCGVGVLVVAGRHDGTTCHTANTTVMTASIISIEGNLLLQVFP